jgi:hypothetical protein
VALAYAQVTTSDVAGLERRAVRWRDVSVGAPEGLAGVRAWWRTVGGLSRPGVVPWLLSEVVATIANGTCPDPGLAQRVCALHDAWQANALPPPLLILVRYRGGVRLVDPNSDATAILLSGHVVSLSGVLLEVTPEQRAALEAM